MHPPLSQMFERLLHARQRSRAARSVEWFGWLMLFEAAVLLASPHTVEMLLRLPALSEQGANYFRLVGLLVGGLGMLYVASGRLNAEGFVFATLLDRPLVPPTMLLLWYLDIVPGALALVFAVSDGLSFLWTLLAWRAQAEVVPARAL